MSHYDCFLYEYCLTLFTTIGCTVLSLISISYHYLILIDMECARCLSNEKAFEEAMKEIGIEELEDKLWEVLHTVIESQYIYIWLVLDIKGNPNL